MNKETISIILSKLKISDLFLKTLNKKFSNNYIRVLNYHFSPQQDMSNFQEQINWLSRRFEFCDFEKIKLFLTGDYAFKDKPGLFITFDDGFLENYLSAYPLLKKNHISAMFMVSPGCIGKQCMSSYGIKKSFMSYDNILQMHEDGFSFGCHTYSHHRMNCEDNQENLKYEIVCSKEELEKQLKFDIELFCWCGGEENTYTSAAAKVIHDHYSYAMMTNSYPILQTTDRYQLDRINIETNYSIDKLKFQICGLMDLRFKNKRLRVHKITKYSN